MKPFALLTLGAVVGAGGMWCHHTRRTKQQRMAEAKATGRAR